MAKKDYYETLGISRDASSDDIRKAFRQLAKKYHPDLNPGNKESEEKFKEINEAFQVLNDPQKKARYDLAGHAAFKPEDFAGFKTSSFDDIFRNFGFGDLFDIFPGPGRRPGPREGADLRYDLEISLEEAFSGITKRIELSLSTECPTCGGTGARPGSLSTCDQCGGTGRVRSVRGDGSRQRITIRTCQKCQGTGQTGGMPCDKCGGQGLIKKRKRIEVKIPAGVSSGQYLRVQGEGGAGERGGPPGDLFVVVHLRNHKIFERQGDDLLCRTVIALLTAISGGEVRVPAMKGRASLKIPAGTQSHTLFRLKGQGMPHMASRGRGDLMVRVVVQIPVNLTSEQKRLLGEAFPEMKGVSAGGLFEKPRRPA